MEIFLVSAKHPCRKIKTVEAEIVKPNDITWAIYKRHRFMLGATAFYTFASARRAKVGYLVKIVNTKALRTIQPFLYERALKLLKQELIE